MEEIVDQLRERATSSAVSLELPSEDELVLVEEEILLPIPREMKCFLLEASDILCGSLEPVTVADPGAHTHLPEVTSNAWAIGLPRELMVLCQTGEAYYCVTQEGEVVFWQDGEQTEDTWEDVWQWAEDVWLNS
ncbi:MAG: SMI1/KNR4 family protein [Kangiellaceae bacterium]|nr:SMI1/KNR4 family protein [Kangiellaceae bacterium]